MEMGGFWLLVGLSLITLALFVFFGGWSMVSARRAQRKGERAEIARARGARDPHDRPDRAPDVSRDGARHPQGG